MELTPKQERFIAEYLVDCNATQAAIRAGYSEKTAEVIGYENLRKPQINLAIEKAMKDKEDQTIAKQDEVLRYLTSVMRGEVDEECVVTEGIGGGMSSSKIMNKQISPRDRNKAAELLAKRYSLLTERLDINGQMVIFNGEDKLED